jgi:membrane peptidoglycan carboxypeptidase
MAKKNEVIEKKENTNNSGQKMEQILIENFVSLQKVMTNLAVKFDNLSGQISKLLELFEISAKTLAEKDYSIKTEPDKKVAEKMDAILEQNKVIAKGIALLHENNNPPEYSEQVQSVQQISPRPMQSNMRPQSSQQNFSGSQSRM